MRVYMVYKIHIQRNMMDDRIVRQIIYFNVFSFDFTISIVEVVYIIVRLL